MMETVNCLPAVRDTKEISCVWLQAAMQNALLLSKIVFLGHRSTKLSEKTMNIRTSINSEQATNLILNFVISIIIPNFIKDSPNRKVNKK